ncbi:transcription factor bHLH [Quillaja saponaria]|uniref:Transcription factor bHLH n=1 Tax=Quillaja saponaria TaxID=32244 RepID=A0AAD7P7K7_QUISA|nr:transcription factor bHLH [Quillaja saponaria]
MRLVDSSNSISKLQAGRITFLSSFEDQLSTNKRPRTESSTMNSNPVQAASVACSGASVNLDKIKTLVRKDVLPRSQVGLWNDDNYGTNSRNAVLEEPQKPEEPAKTI